MNIPFNLVQRYPWLPSKNDYYSNIASKNPIDFIKDILEKYPDGLNDRIFPIFNAAFNNLEEIQTYYTDELNVYLYSILKMLLYIFNSKPIANRIANIYSKQTFKLLEKDKNSNLYKVCRDMGINIKYYPNEVEYKLIIDKGMTSSKRTNFSIHYIDYLKLASGLRDAERKLVHNALKGGEVFLRKKEIARLLQEQVRRKLLISDEIDNANIENFKKNLLQITEIKDLYDRINDDWELRKEEFEYTFDVPIYQGGDLKNSFPPCIVDILKKIDEGQNIIHTARLFLVFYLLSLQFSIDDVVDIFTKLPDFDKKMTEYQVEFAKKKGYSPHSCSTLKSLGLCKAKEYKDIVCLEGYYSKKYDEKRDIQHPLFYLQLMQYRKYRSKTKIETETQKNGK